MLIPRSNFLAFHKFRASELNKQKKIEFWKTSDHEFEIFVDLFQNRFLKPLNYGLNYGNNAGKNSRRLIISPRKLA